MKLMRAFGSVVMALFSVFVALAAFGITTPSCFERAPVWMRAVLLIGACIYLVWWFIADFGVVRRWFRRVGPSK